MAEETQNVTTQVESIEVVDIPDNDEAIETKTSASYDASNIRVLEGLEAGLSIRKIAERAEVTERYVRAVARMYGGRRRQGSLLD